MNAEEFNALYEVGVPVFAYPGARPEDIPSARRLVTRTRTKAQAVGLDREGVVWVDGHGAYIALSHVDPVSEDEFKAAREAETAAAVAAEGALPMPAGPELSELEQVVAEIRRFGIYGAAVPATKALVKRAGELVTENGRLREELAALSDAYKAALDYSKQMEDRLNAIELAPFSLDGADETGGAR